MEPGHRIRELQQAETADEAKDTCGYQQQGNDDFSDLFHSQPFLFDDIAAQDELAIGHGRDKAGHGKQQGCLKIHAGMGGDAVKHKQRDDVNYHGIERQNPVNNAWGHKDAIEVEQKA
jgi:hypothetical protein